MTTDKRPRGRPRKSSQTEKEPEITSVTPTPLSAPSEEVVLQSDLVETVDNTPPIDVELRRRQWDAMTNIDKGKLGMSLDEFLNSEDVTGMGINSRFTLPDERGPTKMRVILRDV